MILEVYWDGLGTLSFGLSQSHGHGSWLVCEVALNLLSLVWTTPSMLTSERENRLLVTNEPVEFEK